MTEHEPEFFEELERSRTPVTAGVIRGWVMQFHAFLGQVASPSSEDLTRFHQELSWKPNSRGELYSENTVNQAIWAVRTYLSWAVEKGYLPEDPSAHLKTRRVPSRKRELTTREKARVLALPDLDTPLGLRDRALLGVLLELKLPRARCAALNLGDLSLDTETLVERRKNLKIHELSAGLLDDLRAYLEFGR
ncbi:MAG: hypothetical protein KC910_36160, partial [Candidatus Eremiobacteraeota bacterium]|nr:hypothetical protein [Candidatus Eremiobacteraeota bacterium]